MDKINKGVILTVEGIKDRNDNYTMARVESMDADGAPSLPITIPWYMRGEMGQLKKGTEVVYVMFEDASGIILTRLDGNWSGTIEDKELILDVKGGICQVKGQIQSE